ncbi:DNRLRE domain-containing protein [Streptomyces actuosus]|uniref:DNRLRE domain-containing protein n=1 Tax=Streptomyces actuosus TaxID=1885 RepID=A0ABS2W117_STRAS|nr:DNRLRE domain-containing protein [Streptomyces actuosus]MBN0048906.1 DNRLRE domain-containing protein [Streptomyces actuosus]
MNEKTSRPWGRHPLPSRTRLRRIALLAALTLSAGLVEAGAAVAAPPRAAAEQPKKPLGPAEAEDAASALLMARLQNRRIEVTGERTDSTTTWADPDGTTTVDTYTGPIRVRDEHGTWRPVDTTLVEGGGVVAPKQAAADVTLSDGGSNETLVEVERGRHSLGVGWKGALPKPVLNGSTATYRGAVEGGDLVVTALREGFTHNVVLRERPDGPVEYRLPVDATGLRLKETSDKRLAWQDTKGNTAAGAPAPVMWDATHDKVSGEPQHLAAVDVDIVDAHDGKGQELVLRPSAAFLADPHVKYPVTIDPTDSLMGPVTDTWVQYDNYLTSQRGSTELKAGTYDGSHKARSFLKFNVSKYTGKHILDAKLRLYSYYSSTCSTSGAGVEVRRITTDWDPSAITWSAQPSTTSSGAVVVKDAKGYNSSCPAGYSTWDVDGIAQAWAAGQANYGLRMAAVSESDPLTWRRYRSANYVSGSHDPSSEPSLTVQYNTKPGAAVPLSPLTGAATNDTTPTLSAKATDADGNTVRLTFEIWKSDGTAALQSGKSVYVASGSAATWTPGTALAEGSYKWRAAVYDGTDWNGTWSAWQTFTVDTTKPGAPYVSSTDYPQDGLWHGGAGTPGTFTLTPASGTGDLAGYVYSLDGAAATTVTTTGSSTVTLTPPADGHRTLRVQAKDKAGNVSTAVSYDFLVGQGAMVQPAEGAVSARRVKLELDAQPKYTRATFQWRRGPGASVYDVPLANLTKADNTPFTAQKTALSDMGAHANWSVLETLGQIGGVVQVRALLYTDSDADAAYISEWRGFTVDPDADGAASDEIGPGSVNLLTGDYSVDVTDADEFGLSSTRTASSRGTDRGWMPQGERLTANERDVSTDTTGFSATTATVSRDTTLGQDGSTDSLKVVPTTNTSGDSFAMVGGDQYAMRLGMQPGRTYRFTAWAYVPSATGLSPQHERGLRLYAGFKTPAGYVETTSRKVPYTDAWAELTLDFTVPADATSAFLRLYNGFGANSGKAVWFDHLSVRELVAPFGPEWAGGVSGGITDNEYFSLTFPGKDVAVLTAYDDTTVTFAKSSDGSFSPEPGAEGLLLQQSGGSYLLTDDDGTITTFSRQSGSDVYVVASVSGTDAASTSRYVYDTTDSRVLVKRVISEVEPGIDDTAQCTGATPARGCEVLEYVYATATTATLGTPGDVVDRVKAVRVWSWDPAAGAETAVDVATYRYDLTGRLVEAWDPRKGSTGDTTVFRTAYTYDGAGRLTSIDTTGELPWYFDYGPAGADQDPGRLLKVRRPALQPGSKDVVEGETASQVVYEVPLTRATGGPYDMAGADVATWGQADAPTDATAIFDVESDPGTHTATAGVPGADGYRQAGLHYLNASAQEVNSATWSPTGVGDVDTTEYDRFGNTVRTLDATGRLLALGKLDGSDEKAAELELPDDSAARAALLDSRSVYSRDGMDLLEEFGPVHRARLDEDVPAQTDPPMPALKSGDSAVVRSHTVHVYDEGKPDGAAYHLETTTRDGARIEGYTDDVEVRVTRTGYDTPLGGTSGWTLRAETSVTTDAVAGGANLTSTIRYDASGRAIESRRPGSDGADTGTVRTVFYTAGANPDDAACGNRPEWAGNPCVTLPGGKVTGADTARMPDTLPVKRITRYSRFGDIEEVTETNAGRTRKTVTTYDAADRILSTEITSDVGQALPKVTTEFDPVTGNAVRTVAGNKTITRVFDALDRLLSYTDADGGTTTTEFDKYSKPVKVSDSTGWTTYTYDRAQEPRGFVTSVTDSVAGTFTAKYGPDGQLVEQAYPGGYVRKDTFDATGAATGRTYTRASDGEIVYGQHIELTTQGAIASDTSSTDSKEYTYDRLGRLTKAVQSTTAEGCVTRSYGFDESGRSIAGRMNRTSKTVVPAAEDGSCATTGGTTTASSYDSADRLLTAGYTYDAFGRTTATGTGSADTYWANDLVATQTAGDTRQNWTVDPALRFEAFTTEKKQADGSWANATSKLNHYGDDSDEPRWIIEDTTQGTLTRNVSGPDGDLVATTSATSDVELQFADLHGDVSVVLDTATTTPKVLLYDEFGVPTGGQAPQRYGWLGAKQRSGEALDGVILMGARLYSPALGRFLQTDPDPGGNANTYDYCSGDPVNCVDLDGHWGFSFKKVFRKVAKVAEIASYIPGPIGNVASAVGAISYAATGNWRKAAEMGVGVAFGSAGRLAVKGFKAARAIRKASRVRRAFSRARTVFRRSRCNSFTPDTQVLMADGGYLPIGAVEIGDRVAAVDPGTGETYAEPVLDVFEGYGLKHLVEIETDHDPATGPLRATADHPLWVVGKGWVKAADVAPGDRLLSSDGTTRPVTRTVDRGEADDTLVVNLNVGDVHTYVVASEGGDLVVHNSSCSISKGRWHHIWDRHVNTSKPKYAHKSKFHTRNKAKIHRMIRHTVKHGHRTGSRGSHVYEHGFGHVIGRDHHGYPAHRLRVVVRRGKVITAFPVY